MLSIFAFKEELLKKVKKEKIQNLNLYFIKNEYIDYLSEFDNHVAYNKNEKRPYIGTVLNIDRYLYYAPLFSPKEKHKKYKNNLSYFRINENNQQLGIIKFSKMIPVIKSVIRLVDYRKYNYEYKRLLEKQYNYINIGKNKEEILFKAKRLYEIMISEKNNKERNFYKSICCNFKLLEEKCNKCMII